MNIGTGRRVSITELAMLLARSCGVPHVQPAFQPDRPGDIKHSLADITLAHQLIGYEPFLSLDDGLVETVEWYRRSLAGT